ncbi:T9SS type A sorting domain-containing protein [Ulvibacter antarcticus]|uniref:Putative secreted protein (Por secretion system target) n=1 Tax=Ulvibacter antarcticus TaxID=442714 RepID=A0A3L9Z0H7_9FLAO|nr:T9SS type A sorting domain-containing protein [Ulvibacter antarcticus]RMA66353.1 putative secreted protein (Por secretion system target) [Ulvibacter antarcticus]
MMKKITTIVAFFMAATTFAQIGTSFEEPGVFTIQYVDTGDANVAHDLINNTDEPFVDFAATSGEIGYNASYTPYDTPGSGLTDGDFVGVTDFAPTATDPYTDGTQGYQISDADGNYILEFDAIDTGATGVITLTMDYFIADTGYEGDGTVNESGSDRFRIYLKDLTNTTEIDILNTTGSDINDLAIQGFWNNANVDLSTLGGATVQLVVEARINAGVEAIYLDNIVFDQLIGTQDFAQDQFSMFPNPATRGYVNISSTTSGAKNVAVYDVLGKQVISTTLTGDRLDISDLNSGIYIVKISQGNTSMTKKLVVK